MSDLTLSRKATTLTYTINGGFQLEDVFATTVTVEVLDREVESIQFDGVYTRGPRGRLGYDGSETFGWERLRAFANSREQDAPLTKLINQLIACALADAQPSGLLRGLRRALAQGAKA